MLGEETRSREARSFAVNGLAAAGAVEMSKAAVATATRNIALMTQLPPFRIEASRARGPVNGRLKIDLVVVPGRNDHLHPLAEQRPEAGPRFHHRVPVLRLLVPAPIERAEIIDHRQV